MFSLNSLNTEKLIVEVVIKHQCKLDKFPGKSLIRLQFVVFSFYTDSDCMVKRVLKPACALFSIQLKTDIF